MTSDARREQYARIIFDRDCGPENWDNTFYLMVRDACYETADAILALESAEIARLKEFGKSATDVLLRWVEKYPDDEHRATLALLGRENSAGWVWARQIRRESDFDAEQRRVRELAIEAVAAAEARAEAAERALTAAREALGGADAFLGVMFGQGPDATIPETVASPLGVIKLGDVVRSIRAALPKHEAEDV